MRKWQLRLCGLCVGTAGSLYGCAELIRYIHAWGASYSLSAPFHVEIALVSLGVIWIIAVFLRTLPSCLPLKRTRRHPKDKAATSQTGSRITSVLGRDISKKQLHWAEIAHFGPVLGET